MKKNLHFSPIIFLILFFTSICAHANTTLTAVTISGSDRIVVDSNKNDIPDAEDMYYQLQYDKTGSSCQDLQGNGCLYLQGNNGFFPSTQFAYIYTINQLGDTASLQEIYVEGPAPTPWSFNTPHAGFSLTDLLTATFSKTSGAKYFNKIASNYTVADGSGHNGGFSIELLDRNRDSIYDTMEGQVNVRSASSILLDRAIEFYPSANNRQYLWIKNCNRVMLDEPGYPTSTPLSLFIPLDNDLMTLKSGEETLLTLSLSSGQAASSFLLRLIPVIARDHSK